MFWGRSKIYCCIPRTPTPYELRLIERVTHVAAIAIQRHNDEEELENLFGSRIDARRKHGHERVYLN